jgi:hypothetical protein
MPRHFPHGCHIIATRGLIRSQYHPSARRHISVQHGTEPRQQLVWHRATSATSMDGTTWRSLSWWHVDQSDHDIWIIRSRHVVIVLVHVATSASSVAPSHVSYQHARRHVVVTFMTKLVTMFSSNRRRVVTWRKTCTLLKRSGSVTKLPYSSLCCNCDAVFYHNFRIVINSSLKVFNDEFGLFRDECFVIDVNFCTSEHRWQVCSEGRVEELRTFSIRTAIE